MAPATTPAKLESPNAEPAVDDKAIGVPVKPEAPRDDELSIQSLPQGTMIMQCILLVVCHRAPCVLSITHVSWAAEVLMQIVGYMDAKHVLQSVSLVNHTFHSLSNGKLPAHRLFCHPLEPDPKLLSLHTACADELLWKTYFRRFCGSLVYSVEEAAWDALPSRFASLKEALATTNAMCFFR